MLYMIKPTQNDIVHYGKGHDDSPPGRGSGRYPWGSGKRPHQDKGANQSIKRLKKAAKTKKYVDDIVDSLSIKEKELLGMSIDDANYLTIEQGEHVIYRELKKIGKIPIAFFDMLDDGDSINLALATRSGDQYRGKGYASDAAKQAMDWLDRHPKERNGRDVIWGVRVDNPGSIAIAKKLGFVKDPNSYSDDGMWVNYVNRGVQNEKS